MSTAMKMKADNDTRRSGDIYNPATGKVIGQVAFATTADVNEAVEKAKKAFESWSQVAPMRRARIMFRFLELLNKNADKLTEIVSTEHGKVWVDAQGEVQRGI